MTNSQDNFRKICCNLEIELSNLAGLGSVTSVLLEGSTSEQAVDGYHTIGETELSAIRWAGFELAGGIKKLFADFLENYEAALKSHNATLNPGE